MEAKSIGHYVTDKKKGAFCGKWAEEIRPPVDSFVHSGS